MRDDDDDGVEEVSERAGDGAREISSIPGGDGDEGRDETLDDSYAAECGSHITLPSTIIFSVKNSSPALSDVSSACGGGVGGTMRTSSNASLMADGEGWDCG